MDADITGRYLRRLELQLLAGRFDCCRAIIDEYEREATQRPLTIDERLDLPLSMTRIDERLVNILDARGIMTVCELLECPRDKLLAMRGINEKSLSQIFDALGKLEFVEQT